MRRWFLLFAAVIVAALVLAPATAFADHKKKHDHFVDETKLPFDPLPGAEALWGVHKGAGFRIEVPADWNGDLVMWAHGFRGTGLELTVDNHPLREYLIGNGFAWAASSYTENNYQVEIGAEDTRALAKHFKKLVDKPDRTYITGASMGGHITAASIEKWKNFYDGAMPICGVVGDFELFDYFLDFNLAAQQLGLGSSQFPVDPAQYIGVDVPDIKTNLSGPGPGWPVSLNTAGMHLKQLTELQSGGDRPNFDEAWLFWNTIPSDAGLGNFLFGLGTGDGTLPKSKGVVIENVDTVYQLDLNPALSPAEDAFNAGIARVAADKNARKPRGLKNPPAITGKFKVPVLSLHNLGDLFVPFHNEIAYAADAAARGNSHLLVQRAIRGVGHCDFTGFELVTAFADLVNWVENGVVPAGDIVSDPAAVADPNYGCAFTIDPLDEHILATPCP